jgi:starvation-inducible outer membrane lipoprotein
MYNCNMLKKVLLPTLLLAVFLSGCSNSSDPAQTNEDAKKCEAIVKLFNERLLLEGKAEKIQGWQLILDNPTCFLSDAVEIAKTEISALQNQP